MLKIYDYLEKMLEAQQQRQNDAETKLNFFVSEVMEILAIEESEEIVISLNRTFRAFGTLQLPFNQNFKKIYRFDGIDMVLDWKISPLACYLIIINCDPTNELVAKAQLHFAMNRMGNN